MDELMSLLEDLGLLANLKTSPVEFAARMFNEYDVDDNGVLGFEESPVSAPVDHFLPIKGHGIIRMRTKQLLPLQHCC